MCHDLLVLPSVALLSKTPRRTLSDWLSNVLGDNATLANTAKAWHLGDNHKANKIAKDLHYSFFQGTLEEFQTDQKFPLIIADPPYGQDYQSNRLSWNV